jgi:probable rRNA maturation factor
VPVRFFSENINFTIPQKLFLKRWINQIIENSQNKTGEVNIIFTSDTYLLEINKKYLNHNYFTDIITFNYNEGINISGDIYISIETVRNNASLYSVAFLNELHRVIIHGILHLLGYNDHTDNEIILMRKMEDNALEQLSILISNS